jgi:hypothetical protein
MEGYCHGYYTVRPLTGVAKYACGAHEHVETRSRVAFDCE